MSARSVYLTETILRTLLDKQLAWEILCVIDFSDNYVSNIETRLRDIGEDELANRLIQEIERLLKEGRIT